MIVIKDVEGFFEDMEEKVAKLLERLEILESKIFLTQDVKELNKLLEESEDLRKEILKSMMTKKMAKIIFKPSFVMN